MDWIVESLEKITKNIGKLSGWLIIPLVIALCYEVFARYVFKAPTIWAFDITYMLMSAIFLIGAAYTLADQRHIKIDFLYAHFPERLQRIADLVGLVVLILPVICYVAFFSIEKLVWAIQETERSDFSPWRPVLWPFRGFIALGYVLLVLQSIAEILKQIKGLIGLRSRAVKDG